jgi:threonylcarbamoyladenosine tRNA methylthiotransferase MtaB
VNIYLDTVGCRLNQSEIETYARQFRAAGHTLVPSADQADLVVVNTCTVTAAAASDSRHKIRQVARAGAREIVVTGCWSTLNPAQAAALPGVSRVVGNLDKDGLVPAVLEMAPLDFNLELVEREPIPGARLRTRAFIKAQDGCNNRCAFCVTRLARGTSRSRTIREVLAEVNAAIKGGSQEIVLTGVHLGAWGHDFSPSRRLDELVRAILVEAEVPRLRLSSLEPWDLPPKFFDLWQDTRLCRHLHLPLQSGCDATLRRMRRKTSPPDFTRLVNMARTAIPEVAITTDIIVGFPGESEAEFVESLDFVQAMQFAGGHVFTYSERPGTAAASMPDTVPFPERKSRNARMQAVLSEASGEYRERFEGQQLSVLWESVTALSPQHWELSGLTDNYLRVHAQGTPALWNQITPVHLTSVTADGLRGTIAGL